MTKRLRNDARANDLERASERARGVAAEEGAGGGGGRGGRAAGFFTVFRVAAIKEPHTPRGATGNWSSLGGRSVKRDAIASGGSRVRADSALMCLFNVRSA